MNVASGLVFFYRVCSRALRVLYSPSLLLHLQEDRTMALATTIREQIDEIADEWIHAGKMFTAFEVSLAVKQRGVKERHRNMREYIHEVIHRLGIQRGDYSRTLMDVGAPEQAWVYHTIGANPYEYVPLDRTGMPTAPTPASARPRGLRNPVKLASGVSQPFAIPPGAYGTDQ